MFVRMLAATMNVLAEPHRLRMLDALRSGPQPVAVLSAAAGLGQPQTSKHLRVMRNAGLVVVAPDGQRRLYSLRAAPLREIDDWLERFRSIWGARFDELDQMLASERGQH